MPVAAAVERGPPGRNRIDPMGLATGAVVWRPTDDVEQQRRPAPDLERHRDLAGERDRAGGIGAERPRRRCARRVLSR